MKIVFEQPVVNVVELATGPKGDAGPASTIPGPANTLTAGTITQIPAGGQPTVSITGTTPSQTLNLGLVDGANGIGVPTTGNNPGDLLCWNGTVWIQTATKFHEGTGNPNGVVTAPVGSTFVNTESGGYNGARRWTKATGSGNTGWVVVDGDTGWGDLIPLLPGATGVFSIRRTTNRVDLLANNFNPTGSSGSLTLPVGYRVEQSTHAPLWDFGNVYAMTSGYMATGTTNLAGARNGSWFHNPSIWPSALI